MQRHVQEQHFTSGDIEWGGSDDSVRLLLRCNIQADHLTCRLALQNQYPSKQIEGVEAARAGKTRQMSVPGSLIHFVGMP